MTLNSLPYPYRVRWASPDGTSCESFTLWTHAWALYSLLLAAPWAVLEEFTRSAWCALSLHPTSEPA